MVLENCSCILQKKMCVCVKKQENAKHKERKIGKWKNSNEIEKKEMETVEKVEKELIIQFS